MGRNMIEQRSNRIVGNGKPPKFQQLAELDDLLTVREVAEYLKIKEVSVYKLVNIGSLEGIKVLPGKLLITKASIATLLERGSNKKERVAA